MQNLGLADTERKDVSTLIDVLQRYVDGYIHETVECRNFCFQLQQPDETFNGFLILISHTCKFCTESCTEKMFSTRL